MCSEIQYLGQELLWVFQIPEFSQRQQWFKLGLDYSIHGSEGTSSVARDFPDNNAAPSQSDHSCEKMVEDYLTALRKHAEQVLKNKLPKGALASTPIDYILTVPAVWSEMAQAKTRACAQRAGMGEGSSLRMISEPEAAAMYALDTMVCICGFTMPLIVIRTRETYLQFNAYPKAEILTSIDRIRTPLKSAILLCCATLEVVQLTLYPTKCPL